MRAATAELVIDCPERDARVTYQPGYLERPAADALLAWMLRHTPWQREAPFVFGRVHAVRRQSFAYGEAGARYRYSGVERSAEAWPAALGPLVRRLCEELRAPFNFGLCNLYPDGDAQLGRHADAEAEILRDSPIAALSLGAARDFLLYDGDGRRVAARSLAHGSLLVMWGASQRCFKHAIPRRRRVCAPRVSITFRALRERARRER